MRRDRPREGRTLRIEFINFATKFKKMRCTLTEVLWNFWPSYRECRRWHFTVCQVNMDTHAVQWMKQMRWDRKVPISNPRWNSIILNLITSLSVYTSYYVTTTSFLTLPIHYGVTIAQWSDECSEQKGILVSPSCVNLQ